MEETRQLAEFVAQVSYDDLSQVVINKAKDLVLDQLGVQLASSIMPWSKAAYEYAKDKGNIKQEATVVNYGDKMVAEETAFVNATFGHGFELDDTDLTSKLHPGCVVISPALAMGETVSIDGKKFLLALVVGYEVGMRIGAAMHLLINRGLHPTGMLGPFASAATTGKILGFDKHQMLNSLGIAGSEAGGVLECTRTGGTIKRLHAGLAAQKGIRAALLAQRGVTGPPTILEGQKGFCQAFLSEYSLEDITKDLGKEYKILTTGTKPYCCCAAQHSAIDAVSSIVREYNVRPEDIREVTVGLAKAELLMAGSGVDPENVTGMQFSTAFGIALRLIKGGNGLKEYTEENLKDPQIRGMAKRINFIFDEDLEKIAKGCGPANVTMRLKNGAKYQKRVDFAKGTIQNPMTKEELRNKFNELASSIIPPSQAAKIVLTIEKLERLNNIDDLTSLLVK